jgi:hypothetical protein
VQRGKHILEHSFLIVDGFIVDFTPRQFWVSDCTETVDCEYAQHLHHETLPYFVGSVDELRQRNKELIALHKKVYPRVINTDFEYCVDRRMQHWDPCGADQLCVCVDPYEDVLLDVEREVYRVICG